MAVTSPTLAPAARPAPAADAPAPNLALAVADANWYSTENLFAEMDRPGTSTLLLKCVDYYNAWKRRSPPWGRPLARRADRLWQRELVLPTGWMKRFPTWGMRPIARSVAHWRERHAPDDLLALVMTYPHYLYLRDHVRPDRCVYFNIDDYAQYWPRCAERVNELEVRAVRESDLTVCVSQLRCEELRRAVPEAAERVRHLPHGTPSTALANGLHRRPAGAPEALAALPGPRLGFIGSLEDRIDWDLLARLADALPDASIVLIGRLGTTPRGEWQDRRAACLARSNVHHLGWRPQSEIARYNAAFDACLIPYLADHPFNLACCPTKIMDCMGTGRPIVSTALPECRLYDRLFDVAETTEAFLEAVKGLARRDFDDGRGEARFAHAQANSCARTAERLLGWLAEA